MKEKINTILNSKRSVITTLVIIITSLIAIILINLYDAKNNNDTNFNKEPQNNVELDKETDKSENTNNENENEEGNIYSKNLMYQIQYRRGDILYDISIDKEFNISIVSTEYDYRKPYNILVNENHTLIDVFNNSQKQFIINYLKSLNYTLNPGNLFEVTGDFLVVKNYEDGKGLVNQTENYFLTALIESIIEKNVSFYQYVEKDNKIENYIKDTNYKKLDNDSDIVLDLYEKFAKSTLSNENNEIIGTEVFDSYKKNELNNNTKISLALYNLLYKDISNSNSYCDSESSKCYIDINLFNSTYEEIFGNTKYDLSTYEGFDTDMSAYFYYDNSNKNIVILYENGDEIDNVLISDIAYAYEKDDKIVIIEKTLYYYLYDTNDGTFGAESITEIEQNKGLYNSPKKEVKITTEINPFNFKFTEELNSFVTYYAHTFTKENGQYYYTSIARLN